jgi:hypothetical protein
MQKYFSEKINSDIKKHPIINTKTCYYLLYKLVTHPTFWIVKVNDNSKPLINHIKNFQSNTERYYIVKKKVVNLERELNTKQFATFKPNSEYVIITETDNL